SGSTANLLFNYGIEASEPLVFGIGSGIFYGYFPFIKVQGMPTITFRNMPGRIMKNTAKRLGISFEISRFKDPEKGMDALDRTIDKGIPVGLRTGVYWLPYMPEAMRFHFNVHHIVVYGRNGDDYLISDPVFDYPVVCSRKDLMKARFPEGLMAPKGFMFYMSDVPEKVDFLPAIEKGIKEVCHVMIHFPLPIIGVRGIRMFGKALRRWPEKYGKRKVPLYLGHAIRMQEEIGTGGGGFRLMYAAFLYETAHITGDDRYLEISKRMTAIGDQWREFAVHGARICKNRASDEDNFDRLSDIILDCAGKEYQLYKDLWEIVK
ncbi:MAG: NlpC/p60-like transpeptidase, partial [Deltaproteobacteria bacterium]|nr:NlpC/p60-like transpeptidase [Deltaproteobacteria bacterium]